MHISNLRATFFVLLCFFCSIQISYADNLPGNKKPLRSASELDYPPFAIVKPDGTAGGFSVDLLKAATEAVGLSVSFKVGPWDELKQELAEGGLDVLPLVSYSEEREKVYDFTAPYLRLNGTVFVRKGDTGIKSLADLKDKEIMVMQGDTAHEYVTREKLTDKIIPTVSYEEAFKILASGRHDAVVVQQIVGLQLIKKLHIANVVPVEQKDIASVKPMSLELKGFEQKFCFAVRQGNQALLSLLNEGLAIVYLNGAYASLYEKWFSPILPEPEVPLSELIEQIVKILVPLFLLFTLFGLWYLNRLVAKRTRFLEDEIAERKLREEALRLQSAMLNNLSEGVALVRAKDKAIVRVNSTFAEMFGYDEYEMIGLPYAVLNASTSEQPELLVDGIITALAETGSWKNEILSRRKDGSPFWSYAQIAVFDHLEHGQVFVTAQSDITVKRQTENELRESEERFRLAIASSPVPIMLHDEDDHVLQLSSGWTKLSGYRLQDIPTLADWTELAYGERTGLSKDYISDLFNIEHTVSNGEWLVRTKDGATRVWDFQTTPLGKINNNRRVLLSIANDITERKQIEDALRESEEIHRALVQGLPDIVMRFDRDGRHLFVSANVTEMVEMQAEQFIGKTHRELGFPDEQCDFWEESIHRVISENQALELEYSFKSKKGHVINNWRLIPEHDSAGQVESVLSLNRDITAQRMAESSYQTLFMEMLDGFALHEILCDNTGHPVDYRFISANPAFERMTGLKVENIIGRTVLEVIPNTEKHWIETYGRVALTGEPVHFENYSTALQKHFEITAFRPAPHQFACIFQDITARKMVEAERELLQAQLIQAQKMEAIGTLAGGIAHDFNNILGAMIGYAEMVREDTPDGSITARDLDQVLTAGNRAKALVKQILAFSRQDKENKILLQPASLVKESIKLLRASIPTTIEIDQDIEPDCGLILAEPTQFHQIVMNLCTNAFHAMEETGGKLSVSLHSKIFNINDLANNPQLQPGNYVQLSIRDTGSGIMPEIREKIFDPYFTTKEVGKGTGMGLAITHGIIKSCSGFIECESQVGVGSIFHAYLPSLKENIIPKDYPIESIAVGTERILLVDDEHILAEMGKIMLERLGYTVTIQVNSSDALTTFKNQPDAFDLVITDQTMPGMTGIDLARRMLEIRPDLPIILCTGYSSQISEEKAMAAGVKGFAFKPLAKKDISQLIRKVFNKLY